jgi:hypothetical protein
MDMMKKVGISIDNMAVSEEIRRTLPDNLLERCAIFTSANANRGAEVMSVRFRVPIAVIYANRLPRFDPVDPQWTLFNIDDLRLAKFEPLIDFILHSTIPIQESETWV